MSAGWIMVATKPVEHLGKETVRQREEESSVFSLLSPSQSVPEAAEAAAANESNFI